MSLRKERKPKRRTRGRGTVIKEFSAIQQALGQTEKGGESEKEAVVRRTSKSNQYFSPELAKLEAPYFATNNVRYLGICGLCDFLITGQGKCTNPECLQEWGDPQKLTDELVSQMIEKGKALFLAQKAGTP